MESAYSVNRMVFSVEFATNSSLHSKTAFVKCVLFAAMLTFYMIHEFSYTILNKNYAGQSKKISWTLYLLPM
jgi:hypothetical protein